jgi:hypothetical protein
MQVDEYIGVYHANGGIVGELAYVLGHALGRTHCALCDITHSPFRRKKQWDAMVAGLDAPFRLLHLNEMPADVAQVVGRTGSPVVLVRAHGGELAVLLGPTELAGMNGSVDAFAEALVGALATRWPALPSGLSASRLRWAAAGVAWSTGQASGSLSAPSK